MRALYILFTFCTFILIESRAVPNSSNGGAAIPHDGPVTDLVSNTIDKGVEGDGSGILQLDHAQLLQLIHMVIRGVKKVAGKEAKIVGWEILSLHGHLFSVANTERERNVAIANVFLEALVKLGCVVDKFKTSINVAWALGKGLAHGIADIPAEAAHHIQGVLDHLGLIHIPPPPNCASVPKEYDHFVLKLMHLEAGKCTAVCQCGSNSETVCQIGERCKVDKHQQGTCVNSMPKDSQNRLVQVFQRHIGDIESALGHYVFSSHTDDDKNKLGEVLWLVGEDLISAMCPHPLEGIKRGFSKIGSGIKHLPSKLASATAELQEEADCFGCFCARKPKRSDSDHEAPRRAREEHISSKRQLTKQEYISPTVIVLFILALLKILWNLKSDNLNMLVDSTTQLLP